MRNAGRVPLNRRGVVAVISMMFLVLFGSLAAAMAISAKGNMRTASTHVHVMRALGAAETGMAVGAARLAEASSRFIVSSSTVDSSSAAAAWGSSIAAFGAATILPPPSGYPESSYPFNIAQALANQHAADQNIVAAVGISTPVVGNAMSGTAANDYNAHNWVYTPALSLETSSSSPLCFQITYAPLANGTDVRVISTGYDYSYVRDGVPLKRTLTQDFRLVKRVNQAVISPSRIMIGKNVMVTGDVGSTFTAVTATNGDPVVMKSDFYGLDPILDTKLNAFFAAVKAYDVDGDNRLRVNHSGEAAGIPSNSTDYDHDGHPDNAFADATRDGYVDDFDVFMNHFDKNHDGKVVLSNALTLGTPAQNLTPEFVRSDGSPIDDDLALMIDSANPDRNKNGVSGFVDTNNNGRWDPGEVFKDVDTLTLTNRDQVLGFRDGVIDYKDQYAKVAGRLLFRTTAAAWAAGQGASYKDRLRGPVRAGVGKSPVNYGMPTTALPDLSASAFDTARTTLASLASGGTFDQQVATQLGVSAAALATYVEAHAAGSTQPRFLRVDPDANMDGKPDNWSTAYYEKMPFNSPDFADWYYRPVYENMTFRDVQIPLGRNALFRKCTFIGVTYVKSTTANTHVLWSEYGKMQVDASGKPADYPPRMIYGDNFGETSYPSMLPASAKPPNQMILMANPPLDKADLTAAQALVTQGYNLLPDPLVIGGLRVTDTKKLSNNLRFHDCLFVGSIVSDSTTNYTHARNKVQFTGATRFSTVNPDYPDDSSKNPTASELVEILKSSMMLPSYSVDIGSFNSPQSQNVQLNGAIVAGVLDVRGNASINGALLLTFKPILGQAPLIDSSGNAIGNPAGFNATLGYFGPADGDNESLDPTTLPKVNGVTIVGWDLDGDGLADLGPTQTPTAAQLLAGAVVVPFNGYGRIDLRFDPNMSLPNGLPLPLQYAPRASTYKEGRP